MAETRTTRDEQDALTTTEGDATPETAASGSSTIRPTDPVGTPAATADLDARGLEPLAQGERQSDEVDQSQGIFPAGVPHPADAPIRPPGALGGGPYDESGRGGVAVSTEVSSSGSGAAGAGIAQVTAGVADVIGEGAASLDDGSITRLNDLIHLDIDAIQAYKHAIDACETAEIRNRLGEFMEDHERHVRDLREAVRSLGGEPVAGRDVKGFFIEGFTAIVSQGDRSALLAMRGNEELTNRRYDAARSADLPEQIRPLIERNYQDEARHLAWIKEAISSRAWDTDAGAKKAA